FLSSRPSTPIPYRARRSNTGALSPIELSPLKNTSPAESSPLKQNGTQAHEPKPVRELKEEMNGAPESGPDARSHLVTKLEQKASDTIGTNGT
ncbi:hypothetical protein LTR28_010292, partial [Elasticomyces elasticus]